MSGWSPRTSASALEPWLNLKSDFGAKMDVLAVQDAVFTAGSPIVTSASGKFKPGDAGKVIQGQGAGTTPATFTATTANGSPILTAVSSTANIVPGQPISGLGIPAGATVVGIITANSIIQISANATGVNVGATMTVQNDLASTILSVQSATQVTMAANAGSSYSAATCLWGSDDSKAWTAALAAMLATGRDLFVPPGSSYAAGGYTIPQGCAVIGSAAGTTGPAGTIQGSSVVQLPGVSADMFTLSKWSRIEHLAIQGNYTVCTGTGRGIVVANAFAAVDDVFVGGTVSTGIELTTSASVGFKASRLILRNCQGNGIYISQTAAFDSDFSMVNIGQSGLHGFRITASDQALSQVHSWGNGTKGTSGSQSGFAMTGGVAGCRFTNCYAETNYDRGFYWPNSGCAQHTLNACWAWKNRGMGFYGFTATKMSFNGCLAWDNGQAGGANANAAGFVNDTGTYWTLNGCQGFDDQGTKTQTYGYFELSTANFNTIVGCNFAATNLKTGNWTIVGANNVPAAASMGTLNQA